MAALTALALATLPVACTNINQTEGDCSSTCLLKFRYDMNLKFADAFAHEVHSLTLFIFDENGKLVAQQKEEGGQLAQEGYAMTLRLDPGTYSFVAWGGIADGSCFSLTPLDNTVSTAADMGCTFVSAPDGKGGAVVDNDIQRNGGLFYGHLDAVELKAAGTQTFTMPMIKDTNTVRIVLQHLSGEPVDVGNFNFSITDSDNLFMDGDNKPSGAVAYTAWSKTTGTAGMTTKAAETQQQVSVAVAEISEGRLMTSAHPYLNIDNPRGERVVSIPLIDYALLVKGRYNADMGDQEYLDRQDEYNLTFFLDEKDNWMSAFIYINSWKIVLENADLK